LLVVVIMVVVVREGLLGSALDEAEESSEET
jgi:hypothetical protein